jgi:hypothetical protein
MRLMVELVFSAFQREDDADTAAEVLQRAGCFKVHRYPVRLRHHLGHPCDDFILVVGDGPPGPCPVGGAWPAEVEEACEKFKNAVFAAIEPYGGEDVMFGPIDVDWVPFGDIKHWGERWDPTRWNGPEPSDAEPRGTLQ